MAYIFIKMCLALHVPFETLTMTYDSIETSLALAMAYIPFEMCLAMATIFLKIECTLPIITSLMFFLNHLPKFIMPFL